MAEAAIFGQLGNLVANVATRIGRQSRYVFCYKSNIKNMKNKADQLEARKREVELLVEAATDNCQIVGPSVDLWLKSIEEKRVDVNLLLLDIDNKSGEGCLDEWCLHLPSRYWLSRKATKLNLDLIDLIVQGNFPTVAYPPPALGTVLQPSDKGDQLVIGSGITSSSTGNFGELQSRSAALENVMEAVRDVNIHTIGVCGIGGVGKTYLIKEVEKRAGEEGLFDKIAFVVVSHNPDIEKIQVGIADFLGLKFEEHSLLARARRLNHRLNQKVINGKPERILIFLDDLWKKLDLEEVGIHFLSDSSPYKIILTSRSTEVCHQMKAARFDIDLLHMGEARSLFLSTLYPTISYPVWIDIVEECGGLPMAIKTIAALLADKEENTWNYVLRKLQLSSLQGEYRKVYTIFQLSYDILELQEVKDIFLLFCLFPEDSDISIERIARYGMGLKIFKQIENLHEARVTTHAHIEALKNLNLLLDGQNVESFKLHDLVRDFGISIASEKFIVRFDTKLKQWPVVSAPELCTHISLGCSRMSKFPNGLSYPGLKLLHLVSNLSPFRFPKSLDEVMGNVQVLDLQWFKIQSLPRSIECLTNLVSLSLSNWFSPIEGLSSIGNIQQLEMLSFAGSEICELPREIGNLTRLRLLDLTRCYRLEKVSPGVLRCLTSLEELYMRDTSILWAEEHYKKYDCSRRFSIIEDQHFGSDISDDEYDVVADENHASFTEVEQLYNLIAVEIDVPYQCVPVKIKLEKLEKFKITVGKQEHHSRLEYQNFISLKGADIELLKEILKALCRKTEILHISVNGLVCLQNVVDKKDLTRLSTLIFENCCMLASVFDQSLIIRSTPLLRPPFGNLRELALTGCNKLQNVCSLSIARGFINLKILRISGCSSIKEVISIESSGDQDEKKPLEFLNMMTLHLIDLPNFVCFSKAGNHEVHLPKLQFVKLKSLPKLGSFEPVMKAASNSVSQHASSTNHALLHQKVPLNAMTAITVSPMEDLIELEVENCSILKSIFPLIVGRGMVKLKSLTVISCSSMENIFYEGAVDVVISNKIEFPNLKTFHLEDLPVMVDFCNSLSEVSLPQLEILYISKLQKLSSLFIRTETLTPGQDQKDFHNLNWLNIVECYALKRIFSVSMIKCMPMLEGVRVHRCPAMLEIFSQERGGEEHDETYIATVCKTINFPRLKTLDLQCLQNLGSFCGFRNACRLPHLKVFELIDVPELPGLYNAMKTVDSDQKVVSQDEHHATIFQADMVQHLDTLAHVKVERNCVVEVAFDFEGININELRDEVKALPQLQTVVLRELPKLRDVWKKVPPHLQGFYNLKWLYVEECSNLIYIFTTSMAKALVSLELLRVTRCKNLESVVSKEEENGSAIQQSVLFPRLSYLELKGLPKLSTLAPLACLFKTSYLILSCAGNINFGDIVQQVSVTELRDLTIKGGRGMEKMTTVFQGIEVPNLRDVTIRDCAQVDILFDLIRAKDKPFPELEHITLISLPNLRNVWKSTPGIIQDFQRLNSLTVVGCDSLRHLITTSQTNSFVNLIRLNVTNCENLEAIVVEVEEEVEKEVKDVILFPRVQYVTLVNLPSLLTGLPKHYTFTSGIVRHTMDDRLRHLLAL